MGDPMNPSTHAYSRQWDRTGMPILQPDGTNFPQWSFLAEAMAEGHCAQHLLREEPATANNTDIALAARLKTFLAFTAHPSFLPQLRGKTALQVWNALNAIVPKKDVLKVARRHAVQPFDSCRTPSEYVNKHHARHAAIVEADPDHYLASAEVMVADLLAGLPSTVEARILKSQFELLSAKLVTQDTVHELTSKILELTHKSTATRIKRDARQDKAKDRPERYGRKPFDTSIKDYKCMHCMMDNHEDCGGKRRPPYGRTASPTAAAASSDAGASALNSIAGSILSLLSNASEVNTDQSYSSCPPVLDTAASHHCLRSADAFNKILRVFQPIRSANGAFMKARAMGDSVLRTARRSITLRNAFHVPSLTRDLISAARLAERFDILIRKNRFFVLRSAAKDPANPFATGTCRDHVYEFDIAPPPSAMMTTPQPRFMIPGKLATLHETFGHVHSDALKRLVQAFPTLESIFNPSKAAGSCEPCNRAKLTRQPHRPSESTLPPLGKVSLDTAGPLSRCIKGNKYFTVAVDKSSGHISALPTATKADAGPALVRLFRRLQLAARRPILRIHSDRAPELSSGAPRRFANSTGAIITTAVPNSPQMNGQAERAIGVLKACARAQLQASGLPQRFWSHAIRDCAEKLNLIPKANNLLPPIAILFRSIPTRIHRFLPFGTHGFVPNKKRGLRPLEARGLLRRYLCSPNEATYELVDPKTNALSTARVADFVPRRTKLNQAVAHGSPDGQATEIDLTNTKEIYPAQPSARGSAGPEHSTQIHSRLRPRSSIRPPLRFREPSAAASETVPPRGRPPPDPRSITHALRGPHPREWAEAHDAFIDRSIRLGAWSFVDALPTDEPIPLHWAYRYKTGSDGYISGLSARCTARGDLMKPGKHFDPLRTAAQSPSHTARRLLYAYAALNGEDIRSVDVPGAYPRAPADTRFRVTMRQPRRANGTFTAPGKLVLIQRAQMGSPDGGYLWERHRNDCLKSWGWKQLQSEPATFLYEDATTGAIARLLADTDDFLVTSASTPLLDRIVAKLRDQWDVTEQRPVSQHMGIAVEKTSNGIKLSVRKHINQLLSDFGMEQCNAAKLPYDPKADLTAKREDEPALDPDDTEKYHQGLGLARFITDTVVYEISYITAELARHLHSPSRRHKAALKHLIRYLAGRRGATLHYRRDADGELTAYSDSDWANCKDTRHSRTGIAIKYGGDLIYWRSSLQKSVTLSSTEAEYMAASETARVITWLRQVCNQWRIPVRGPTKLYMDNTAAIAMTVANGPTTRSKHIDTRSHYVREQVQRSNIVTKHIPGIYQIADMFTKPVPRANFERNLLLIRTHGSGPDRG